MKVLHIIPSISPLRGGPSQAVIEMVRALRNEGIDACIVTTEDNGIYKSRDIPVNQWVMYKDVPILVHSCLDSHIRTIREYLISFSFAYWLLRNIRSYDVVHIHALFSFPSTIGMIISRVRGVPYIIRTIGQLNSWSLSQSAVKKKAMLGLVENKNLRGASAIHVTSKYEQLDLEKFGLADKCFIVGLGVVVPFLNVNETRSTIKGRVRFLFLSRIHPKKRLELLLKALAFLKDTMKEERWELAIAGTGDHYYLEMLKSRSKELRIENKIVWHGHVDGDAKQNLFRSSDWFVLPSASENFGIAVVEAMAASIPVIVSDKIGISDKVIKYSAGYICSEGEKDLAKVLSKAINCSGYSKMSDSARKLVSDNYSWDKISKLISELYLSLY